MLDNVRIFDNTKCSDYCKFEGATFYKPSLVSDELILFIVTLMCLFCEDYFLYIKYIYKNMTPSNSR